MLGPNTFSRLSYASESVEWWWDVGRNLAFLTLPAGRGVALLLLDWLCDSIRQGTAQDEAQGAKGECLPTHSPVYKNCCHSKWPHSSQATEPKLPGPETGIGSFWLDRWVQDLESHMHSSWGHHPTQLAVHTHVDIAVPSVYSKPFPAKHIHSNRRDFPPDFPVGLWSNVSGSYSNLQENRLEFRYLKSRVRLHPMNDHCYLPWNTTHA